MDHRPLTEREILERCSINLTETYFALAAGAEGIRSIRDNGIIGLESTSGHPVSNFCFIAGTDLQAIQRLQHRPLAPTHNFYVLPTTDSEIIVRMMQQHGFDLQGQLTMMFMVNTPKVGPRVPVESLIMPEEREKFVRYLTHLFFINVNSDYEDELSVRTARATNCELLRLGTPAVPAGGAMRTKFEDTMGLYNIAIATEMRHRGLGSAMIGQLSRDAAARGCYLTLQCDEQLVPWYERLGFRRVAEVRTMRRTHA